jgi:predicted MPP superfamily phosphohydrolase
MKESVAIIQEITSIIESWESKLSELIDPVLSFRRNSQNRTVKQILGHLIDSTSNNTHRVVHLQYQKCPFEFPNYATGGNNDRWIAIQNYQEEDWKNMIQLWKYSLLHFCHVIQNVKDSKLENEWISGPGQRITLKTMIVDFPRHLKLHMSEIEALIQD